MIIYSRLKLTCEKPVGTAGPKIIHFTKEFCDAEYFAMLTAEKAVTKKTGLIEYTIYEKKKHGIRNEALDCKVYAYAAMVRMLPNFEKLKIKLDNKLKEIKERRITEPEPETENKKETKQKTKKPKRKKRIRTHRRNTVTNW